MAGLPGVGKSSVADELGRRLGAGVRCTFVEVVCSDTAAHRRRLEGRRRGIPAFPEPTWEQVEAVRRAYAPWADPVLSVDTMRPLPEVVDEVLGHLRP